MKTQSTTSVRCTSVSSAEFVARAESAPAHPLQRFVDSSRRQTTQAERLAQLQPSPERDKPNGLPRNLRAGIETLSGMDMSDVVVHRNSAKPEKLNALAYAQGREIHLGAGQERHLPHEAWHVVQQAQGRVKPTMQMKEGVPVNDDERLEREANAMGAKALQLVMSPTHVRAQRGQYANGGSSGDVAQCVLTRSMVKTINETKFADDEGDDEGEKDKEKMRKFLKGRVGDQEVDQIIQWITANGGTPNADILSHFSSIGKNLNVVDTADDADEEAMNKVDHGDLDNYENADVIKQTLKKYGIENSLASATSLSAAAAAAAAGGGGGGDPMQMARKGNTVSGPKSYPSKLHGSFINVSYSLDPKGAIDFTQPQSHTPTRNPVEPNSLVDLKHAGVVIDKKNRQQHFSLGDWLYARDHQYPTASETTRHRQGLWTWHHLATPYKMVLVDMTVHAKHGHNGGVILW